MIRINIVKSYPSLIILESWNRLNLGSELQSPSMTDILIDTTPNQTTKSSWSKIKKEKSFQAKKLRIQQLLLFFTQKNRFESTVLFHQFQPKPKIPLSSWTFELLNIRLYKTINWCFSRNSLSKILLSLITEKLNYFCISQVYLCIAYMYEKCTLYFFRADSETPFFFVCQLSTDFLTP